MSRRHRRELEVQLHSVSISALDGDEGRGLAPKVVAAGKTSEKRLGGPPSGPDVFVDEEIPSHLV
jgi:hypothetical protein